jgi:hypothetical protein
LTPDSSFGVYDAAPDGNNAALDVRDAVIEHNAAIDSPNDSGQADVVPLWSGTAEPGNFVEWVAGHGGQLQDGEQPPKGPRIDAVPGDEDYGNPIPGIGYTCVTNPLHTNVATTMTVVRASDEQAMWPGFSAHTGKYVVKAVHHGWCDFPMGCDGAGSDAATCTCTTTTQEPSAGTRLFRNRETEDPAYFASGLYYGVWVYIPTVYTFTHDPSSANRWLIIQFKSHAGAYDDPAWVLEVENRIPQVSSPMFLSLAIGGMANGNGHGPYDQCSQTLDSKYCNRAVKKGQFFKSVQPSLNLPVGAWTHIEVFLKQWPQELYTGALPPNDGHSYDGRITVWQDSTLLYDLGGPNDTTCGLPAGSCHVMTKYGNDLDGTKKASGANEWAFNVYSNGMVVYPDGHGPGAASGLSDGPGTDPAIVYFDDATIATAR